MFPPRVLIFLLVGGACVLPDAFVVVVVAVFSQHFLLARAISWIGSEVHFSSILKNYLDTSICRKN